MRQCCGNQRGFVMHIANNFNQVCYRWNPFIQSLLVVHSYVSICNCMENCYYKHFTDKKGLVLLRSMTSFKRHLKAHSSVRRYCFYFIHRCICVCVSVGGKNWKETSDQNCDSQYRRNQLCFVDIQWIHAYKIGICGYGYPRKICIYGYGYRCKISYPRQAWYYQLNTNYSS